MHINAVAFVRVPDLQYSFTLQIIYWRYRCVACPESFSKIAHPEIEMSLTSSFSSHSAAAYGQSWEPQMKL